jgi:hypothetical protein
VLAAAEADFQNGAVKRLEPAPVTLTPLSVSLRERGPSTAELRSGGSLALRGRVTGLAPRQVQPQCRQQIGQRILLAGAQRPADAAAEDPRARRLSCG